VKNPVRPSTRLWVVSAIGELSTDAFALGCVLACVAMALVRYREGVTIIIFKSQSCCPYLRALFQLVPLTRCRITAPVTTTSAVTTSTVICLLVAALVVSCPY
jgi:hypothetical protein